MFNRKNFFVVAAPADTEKAPRKGLSTKAFEGQSLDQLVNQGRLINGWTNTKPIPVNMRQVGEQVYEGELADLIRDNDAQKTLVTDLN